MLIFSIKLSYLAFLTHVCFLQVGADQALVSDAHELRNALEKRSIHTIALSVNIAMLPEVWGKGKVLLIDRDVTVQGDAPDRVLDLNYAQDRLHIATSKTLVFKNLHLQAMSRDVSEALVVVNYSPGAMVKLVSCQRLDAVCEEAGKLVQYMNEVPRPAGVAGQQLYVRGDATGTVVVKGITFQAAGIYKDVALVPAHGNYTLHNINTTKMCRNFINASCLALYDGYLNCLQALQRLDDSDHAMNDLPPGKKPSSGKKTVIIITCLAVVTGVAVAGAVAFVIVRRRRDRLPSGLPQGSDLLCPPGISLGKLIGSGAYGRVFQGTWHGQPVAVKVIMSTGGDRLHRVANETKLSLSFDHPNVVKALFYTTSARTTGGEVHAIQSCSREGLSNRGSKDLLTYPGGNSGSQEGRGYRYFTGQTQEHSIYMTGQELTLESVRGPESSSSRTRVKAGQSDSANRSDWGNIELVSPEGGGAFPRFDLTSAAFQDQHVTSSSDPTSSHASVCMETWIVQELCELGPLTRALSNGWLANQNGTGMNMLLVLLRARDVARGMAYLHGLHVCHGDLKPENVLLVRDDKDPMGCRAKVADFGISRALTEGRTHLSTQTLGTVTHMSPELLTKGRLGAKADIFSFGILLWELVSGHPPYQGLSAGEIIQKVVVERCRPLFADPVPAPYQSLAESCWHQDPDRRPDMGEVGDKIDMMLGRMMAGGSEWSAGKLHVRVVQEREGFKVGDVPCLIPGV